MTEKICSRCKQPDREYPYTLYGETGELIRLKHNKIVCYHCWNMIVNNEGHYMGLDENNEHYYSTDEIAFGTSQSSDSSKGWFDQKSNAKFRRTTTCPS